MSKASKSVALWQCAAPKVDYSHCHKLSEPIGATCFLVKATHIDDIIVERSTEVKIK